MSTRVRITNTYPNRSNTTVKTVPTPEPTEDLVERWRYLDDWWWDAVFPLTGDGKGQTQDALYEAEVIDSDAPELIGQSYSWG